MIRPDDYECMYIMGSLYSDTSQFIQHKDIDGYLQFLRAVGFVELTHDGIVLTPAGLAFYLLESKVKELEKLQEIVKGFQQ